jgi:hypothetical protein
VAFFHCWPADDTIFPLPHISSPPAIFQYFCHGLLSDTRSSATFAVRG